jgi:hypothetical protein
MKRREIAEAFHSPGPPSLAGNLLALRGIEQVLLPGPLRRRFEVVTRNEDCALMPDPA